ncbi:MAG: fimbrillin family protein, partial [Muribaculaceae bacterium]|nr:fimbrillin family protein [Muribaculaceae bacterium]
TFKIKLTSGTGYSDEDLQNVDIAICGLRNAATVNLANGAVLVTGDAVSIIPAGTGLNREATIVPQSVTDTELIVVTTADDRQALTQSLNIEPGKEYSFEIIVEKTSVGMKIQLTGWDVIDKDFGGAI